MKRFLSLLLCVVFVLSLCACNSKSSVTDEMFALDTIITFTIYGDDESISLGTIDKCKTEISRLEDMLSATKEGSDVYKINHSKGDTVEVSDETASLIKRSVELSQSCLGAFDISVYPIVQLWGFDTKEYKVPDDKEIADTLKNVGYDNIVIGNDNTVTLGENMSIDLGAVAKGYIGERLYDILAQQDIERGLINLGGMVIAYNCSGNDADWQIGVEYPDSSDVFAVFKTNTAFTVTSGAYQRYFEENSVRYHHIIDPNSGKPSDSDISSVTVITSDGVAGDALSTAFFVMGIDKTLEYIKTRADEYSEEYSFIILNSEKDKVYISADLADGGFEIQKAYEDLIELNTVDTMPD